MKTRNTRKTMKELKLWLKKCLNWIKRRILSTRRGTSTTSSRLTRCLITSLKRLSLYSRCDELLLYRFIKCLDGDLNALKRVRFVPKKWIIEAWTLINEEYAKEIDADKYSEITNALKGIYRDTLRLLVADSCVNILLNKYSEDAVNTLRKMGYKYKFDPSDREKYNKELTTVSKNLKMLILELEANKKSYMDKTKVSPRKENITETLVALSRFMQYRVDPMKTTVKEYVLMMNKYKQEIEINLKQWQQKK